MGWAQDSVCVWTLFKAQVVYVLCGTEVESRLSTAVTAVAWH